MNVKQILVPTDFSNEANNALHMAVSMANKFGSEILLLNCISLPEFATPRFNFFPQTSTYSEIIKEFEQAGKTKLKDTIESLQHEGVKIKPLVRTGTASFTITQTAEEEKVDLIIMGTAGASGLKDFTIGSITEKVVRHSIVPVLSTTTSIREMILDHILFSSNFEIQNGYKNFAFIKELAEAYNAHLHLLRVNTPLQFMSTAQMQDNMEEFAKNWSLKNYSINHIDDFDEISGIQTYAKEIEADIIALGTHGRTGLNHLFKGSIAEDLVNEAKKAVLTIRID